MIAAEAYNYAECFKTHTESELKRELYNALGPDEAVAVLYKYIAMVADAGHFELSFKGSADPVALNMLAEVGYYVISEPGRVFIGWGDT